MKSFFAALTLSISNSAFAGDVIEQCFEGIGCLYQRNNEISASSEVWETVDEETESDFIEMGYQLASIEQIHIASLKSRLGTTRTITIEQAQKETNDAGDEAVSGAATCAVGAIICGASGSQIYNPISWLIVKSTCVAAGLECSDALKKFYKWKEAQKVFNEEVKKAEEKTSGSSAPKNPSEGSPIDMSGGVLVSSPDLPEGHVIVIEPRPSWP